VNTIEIISTENKRSKGSCDALENRPYPPIKFFVGGLECENIENEEEDINSQDTLLDF
jgi:hypothetical protein